MTQQSLLCPPHVKAAITRFDNAAQEYAFRGTYHPEDRESVVEEYHNARKALEEKIAKLAGGNTK